MTDKALVVDAVSKTYRIWNTPTARLTAPVLHRLSRLIPGSLGRMLRHSAAAKYTDFQALSDISFSLDRGESIAIIGRNGSGKSTLLQIIAGTLQSSSGRVTVNGRVAALLELGSGFSPEFTGRENIRLNGLVLGLAREGIEERLESIIAYADIGEFIDQPVKTYSSGMAMRLAFAVAAHVDAEILIIDEALSVGDARFQLKCAKTIDSFIDAGKTLVFVSHDFSSVKRLCRRAILLERGHCLLDGPPNTVVNFYTKMAAERKSLPELQAEARLLSVTDSQGVRAIRSKELVSTTPPASTSNCFPNTVGGDLARAKKALLTLIAQQESAQRTELLACADRLEPSHVRGHEFSYGGERGRIEHIEVNDSAGGPCLVFTTGDTMLVRMTVAAVTDVLEPLYALTVKSANGQDVYVTNTYYRNMTPPSIGAGSKAVVEFRLSLNLMPAEYFLSFGWVTFQAEELVVIHRRYDAIKFRVLPVDKRLGIANLHSEISISQLP